MPVDTPITDLVRQLGRVGIRPPEKLAERILERSEEAREPLLALATNTQQLLEDAPACWGPIHALRLLAEARNPEDIAPLLAQFPLPIEYEGQTAPVMWGTDAVQLTGRIGAPAVDTLWQWYDNPIKPLAARAAASEALAHTTVINPEVREPIIAGMRQRLAESDDRQIAALAVNALSRLGVAELYGEVIAAYRAGRVDGSFFPASSARQLLLGGGATTLTCANHSLWERYDDHGPRETPEDE